MFINGEWQTTANTFAVTNPATGEEIGQVANDGEVEGGMNQSGLGREGARGNHGIF